VERIRRLEEADPTWQATGWSGEAAVSLSPANDERPEVKHIVGVSKGKLIQDIFRIK
jgi:hypothetical protein